MSSPSVTQIELKLWLEPTGRIFHRFATPFPINEVISSSDFGTKIPLVVAVWLPVQFFHFFFNLPLIARTVKRRDLPVS